MAQFDRVTVDIDGVGDWRDMVHAIEQALGHARDGIRSEHLVARLRVTGATMLAWRIRRIRSRAPAYVATIIPPER